MLGSIYHTSFSEYGNDFVDTAVADAHGQFVADLQAIEDEIGSRESSTPVRYDRLLPSNIPNSTNN